MTEPQHDDPVARNRAANPRRTPGRVEVGHATTRRLFWVTAAAILAATVVLAAVLVVR